MGFSFVSAAQLAKRPPVAQKPRICASCEQPSTYSRRQALHYMASLPLAWTITAPLPASADRTGKYSTKLTAKRRYLPRINRGLGLLRGISPSDDGWKDNIGEFAAIRDDLVSALRLFGTSFFAEGNRIGPTERALKEFADELDKAAKQLIRAADTGDRKAAGPAYEALMRAANSYADAAKLQELLPDLNL